MEENKDIEKIKSKRISLHQEVSIHSGPLPNAEQMERYEKICTGAADRILKLAEEQTKHRQKMENIKVKSASRDSLLGLVFAFLFCTMTILCATYMVINDYAITGTIFGGVGLVGIVSMFIQGSSRQK